MTPNPDPTRAATPDATRTSTDPPTVSHPTDGEPGTATMEGVRALEALRNGRAVPVSTPVEPPPGFLLEKEIGAGGMGVVYLARQQGLNRPVALKLVKASEKVDSKALIRFLAEAEAVAAVRHPNVVEVYQYGEHAGKPYLALEYCPSGDLTTLTKANPDHTGGGAADFRRIAELMAKVADGVNAAHAQGIVHRDLKPANVLLTADGTPKVADFGLAKRGVGSDLTNTQAVMGTPAYMAPEQAGGGTKFVGPEADVWALGVMLYELCSGERPIDTTGPLMDAIARVAKGEVPKLRTKAPTVPTDLALITHKCLGADPRDRYPTAGGLAADLRNWLDGKPISARPTGVIEQAVKWSKRNKKLAVMGVAVLLATTAGAVTASVFAVRASRSEADAVGKAREATAAQKAAEEATVEARRRLVRLYVAAGARAEDAADFGTALHWYQKAWDQDRDDPESDPSHRLRIGGVLNEMPHLLGACFQAEKVCDASFSPDGTRIVTRGEGNEAVVWDYERSTPACPPLRHSGRVRHVCFSPDGRSVATASADGSAVVWDAATGARRYTLKHDGPLTWVAFHPDGTRVLTTAEDKTVRMWDAGTGAPKEWKLPYDAVVDHAAFSPDGTRLLTAGRDNTTRVWTVEPPAALSPAITYRASTDEERYTFNYDRWPRFSPDGKTVASFKDKELFVWPGGGADEVRKVTLPYFAIECHFVGDANRLFVTGKSNNVGIVRLSDGQFEVRFDHTRNVNIGAASVDGKWLIAPISGGQTFLWNTSGAKEQSQVFLCTDFCSAVAFSADGRRILTASQDGAVRVWAAEPTRFTERPYAYDCGRAHYAFPEGKRGETRTVRSSDGKLTVQYGTSPNTFKLVSATGGVIREQQVPFEIKRVQFSGSGSRFLVVGASTVRAWLATTGEPAGPEMPLPKQTKKWIDFVTGKMSDDGTRLAMADDDKTFSVWDTTTGHRVMGPTRHENPGPVIFGPKENVGRVTEMAVSTDGKRLAVALDAHGAIACWDVDAGRLLHLNRRYTGTIGGIGISDDGRKLGAVWDKGFGRVFDVESGEPIGPAFRREGTSIVGDVTNDARLIMTRDSTESTFRLWDLVRGERLLSINSPGPFHPSWCWFTADSRSLITRKLDGTFVRVQFPRFDAPADTLAPLAQFLTGQQIDAFDGIEAVDPFTFRGDPAKYRRAYLAWKGIAGE